MHTTLCLTPDISEKVEEGFAVRMALGWVGPLQDLAAPLLSSDIADVSARVAASGLSATDWLCDACYLINTAEEAQCRVCTSRRKVPAPASGSASPAKVLGSGSSQARGACTNGSCPIRSIEACKAFSPMPSSTQCSYCGCESAQHVLQRTDRSQFLQDSCRMPTLGGLDVFRRLLGRVMELMSDLVSSMLTSGPSDLVVHIAVHINALLDARGQMAIADSNELRDRLEGLARLGGLVVDKMRLQEMLREVCSDRLRRNILQYHLISMLV